MWFSDLSDDDQKQLETLDRQGLTGKVTAKNDPSFFDGGLSAIGQGVKAAGGKLLMPLFGSEEQNANLANGDKFQKDLFDYKKKHGQIPQDKDFDQYIKESYQNTKNNTLTFIEETKPDQNSGTGANILYGLSDYVTRGTAGAIIGGVGGAAYLTGQSEYSYVKADLMHKGVDESTATKVAATDAVVAGGATYLPLAFGFRGTGGLAKDAALSIGANVGVMNAGRATSGAILDHEGYEKESKYYEITPTTLTTDVALAGLLFGAGRYAKSRQKVNPDAANDINNTDVDAIQARNEATQDTLIRNDDELQDITPAPISNPGEMNRHYQNNRAAAEQILSGKPVNVPNKVNISNLTPMAQNIATRAQQANIDPSVALTISHIETGGSFSPSAKNPNSTAHGLFQVLDGTWKELGGRDRFNTDEQIRIGLKHIELANKTIAKNIGRQPVGHEQYLGHLLGAGGASKVLKADKNALLIDVVKKYDKDNADAIVNNNGMAGLTVGQAIAKWESKWIKLSGKYGGSDKYSAAIAPDGSVYDMQYDIRPMSELIASNDAAFGVNPLYPSELQPRDRTRAASRQQVENMANDLRPELLGESHRLSDGAPIIGDDFVVESGNGRTMAINQAYETGKASNYEAMVRDFAEKYGIDITAMDRPVLVRKRLSDVDRVQFTRLANESDVAQMSSTERAKSDVDRLPDTSMINVREDGSLNIDQSIDFIRQFIDAVPKSERADLMTPDGRLSQNGKRRLETAINSKAYGDDNLVARLSENLGEDGLNILNALNRNAPRLTQLNDLVAQGGRHQNTIAQDAAAAVQKYSDLKANGVKVKDYLNQEQLFDDGLSDGAKKLLDIFDDNARSSKAIGDYIRSQIDEVEAKGDPRQGSLFGDDPDSLAVMEVINNHPDQMITVKRINKDGTETETEIPLSQYMQELEAEVKQAELDNTATQAAITCALQFGE